MIQDSSDDEHGEGEGKKRVEAFKEMVRKKSVRDSVANVGSFLRVKDDTESEISNGIVAEKEKQNQLWNEGKDSEALNKESSKHEEEEGEKEEKANLQLYAFVARCIAYPFAARYKHDTNHGPPKLSLFQLEMAKDRFTSFLTGHMKIPADDAFKNAISSFYHTVLKSGEITKMVEGAGWSVGDFTEVFKRCIQEQIWALPDFKNLSKQTLLDAWMERFELIFRGETEKRMLPIYSSPTFEDSKLSREQLFEMFQKVLKVRRRPHQILLNLMQLDNNDEQAAQVRRELDSRQSEVHRLYKTPGLTPKCLTSEMDVYYIHEMQLSIDSLKKNLQSVPVVKNEDDAKEQGSIKLIQHKDDEILCKQDLLLNFRVQITIKDMKGLEGIDSKAVLFCTFEMDSCHKLSTPRCRLNELSWDVQADFITSFPLTSVKVKLCQEVTGFLGTEDKEVAKMSLASGLMTDSSEWYNMVSLKHSSHKNISIRLSSTVDKPHNVKCFGELFASGKTLWKKWKKRYFILIQVSQFTFALCSYIENKGLPTNFIVINNHYTLDYCEEVSGQESGLAYFMLTKEGEEVIFATEDESSLLPWIQSIYRATGQTLKPQLLNNPLRHHSMRLYRSDKDRMMKKLLDDLASNCPSQFNHQQLFLNLQRLTLAFRLHDSFTCTYGWLSADQMFVLDEYCERYGVRVFERNMGYLEVLMEHAGRGVCVDASLLYQKFSFCVAHLHGNKPAQTYTVTLAEMQKFIEVSNRLYAYLEHSITNFKSSFPFGRPSGGLKTSLSLFERVKRELVYFEEVTQNEPSEYRLVQILPPVKEKDMEEVVKDCLSRYSLQTYLSICEQCHFEEAMEGDDMIVKRDAMMEVAKACIATLEETRHFHVDAFSGYKASLHRSTELLWDMLHSDLINLILPLPLSPTLWELFLLFQQLNEYLLSHEDAANEVFHKKLCQLFAPICVHYLSSMQLSIHQSIIHQPIIIPISTASYLPFPAVQSSSTEALNVNGSEDKEVGLVEDVLWKLESLSDFINDLNWPEEVFREHLKVKVKQLVQEACLETTQRLTDFFYKTFDRLHTPNDLLLNPSIYHAINSVVKLRDLFSSNVEINEKLSNDLDAMTDLMINKLSEELRVLLKRTSMYDPSSLTSLLLSLQNPSETFWQSFTDLATFTLAQLPKNIPEESFCQSFLQKLHQKQVVEVQAWLETRRELSAKQLTVLHAIWTSYIGTFKEGGVDVRKAVHYNEVSLRIQAEIFLKSTASMS